MATGDVHNELVKCYVCKDIYRDPRALPCLHTFCAQCIADRCEGQEIGSTASCPVCEQQFLIPCNGSEGFKKNHIVQQLLELLQCYLCEGIYIDPRAVACLHTFCAQCIEQWCEGAQPGEEVPCPKCDHGFVVPEGGVDDLQRNIFVVELLRTHNMANHMGRCVSGVMKHNTRPIRHHRLKQPSVVSNSSVDEVRAKLAHSLVGDGRMISGLALSNNGELYVTRYGLQDVSVYDSTTMQLKQTISVLRAMCPSDLSGLAVCPSNKSLVVSVCEHNRVYAIDLPTGMVTNWGVADGPRGLSFTVDHDVVVTCGWRTTSKVQKYTKGGQLLKQVSHGNRLWQAIETDQRTLMVTRWGPTHDVAVLSWRGQLMRCLDNNACCSGLMNNPRALAVTMTPGIVHVTDMLNNRIQILDSSLVTAYTLQLPVEVNLNRPLALAYDESRRRLFVGEEGGEKRLVVLDYVTKLSHLFSYPIVVKGKLASITYR